MLNVRLMIYIFGNSKLTPAFTHRRQIGYMPETLQDSLRIKCFPKFTGLVVRNVKGHAKMSEHGPVTLHY